MENTEIRNKKYSHLDRQTTNIFPEEIMNSRADDLFQHRNSRGKILYLLVLGLTSVLLVSLFLVKVPTTIITPDGQKTTAEHSLFQLLINNGVAGY